MISKILDTWKKRMLMVDLPDVPMEKLWNFRIPYTECFDAKIIERLGEIIFIAECKDGLVVIVKKEGEVFLDRIGAKFKEEIEQ